MKLSELVKPWPKQRTFFDATRTYEYTLFGGAAGPGKSYALRWWLVDLLRKWAAQGHRGVRVGLFCESYPALEDRHLSKIRFEFPLWLGRLNEQAHEFRLWPRWGSGVIAFRNLDKPEKYMSAEFAAIAVDEITQNEREVFDFLRSRKRWPGIAFNPFAAAANPGGIGHGWVKKLWIDRDFSGDDAQLDPAAFCFVPAKAGDNPALPPSYLKTLEGLPEAKRRAWLEGDWDTFVGQVFGEWRREKHVIAPADIPAEWPRWRCLDYGYNAPFCCLWLARSPLGEVYAYRELYARELTDVEQARRVAALSTGERIDYTVCDPACFNRQPNGTSVAQVYAQNGVVMVPGNNDRLAGWQRVHEYLGGDPPRLRVFASCANLIRTLPALVYDAHRVEDVDTQGEDHAADALRYGLMGEARPASQWRSLAFKVG